MNRLENNPERKTPLLEAPVTPQVMDNIRQLRLGLLKTSADYQEITEENINFNSAVVARQGADETRRQVQASRQSDVIDQWRMAYLEAETPEEKQAIINGARSAKTSRYSLEEAGVENLQGDAIISGNAAPEVLDWQDIVVKQAIVRSVLEELQDEAEGRNLAEKVLDFTALLNPINDLMNFVAEGQQGFDSPSEAIQREVDRFFFDVPVEDAEAVLRENLRKILAKSENLPFTGESEDVGLRYLSNFVKFNNTSLLSQQNIDTGLAALDFATLFPLTKSAAGVSALSGNLDNAARLAADDPGQILKSSQVSVTDDVKLEISGIINAQKAAKEQVELAASNVDDYLSSVSEYIDSSELNKIAKATQTQLNRTTEYGGRVLDVQWIKTTESGAPQRTDSLYVFIGNKDGQPFRSETAARAALRLKKLPEVSEVVPLELPGTKARKDIAPLNNGQTFYHGSVNQFSTFSKDFLGSNTGAQSSFEGFFFTSNREVASSYSAENIIETKLWVQSPKVIDAKGKAGKEFNLTGSLRKAKAEGYDAVVFKNLRDDKTQTIESDVVVVFDESQISNAPVQPVKEPRTGKWLIRAEHSPRINGGVFQYNMDQVMGNRAGIWWYGARQKVDDRFISSAQVAESMYNNIRDQYNGLVSNFVKTPAEGPVWRILDQGMIDQKWYSPQEFSQRYIDLTGKSPSKTDTDAYYAAKGISDLNHYIENKALRETLNADNWRFVSEVEGGQLIKPLDFAEARKNKSSPLDQADFYDLDTGKLVLGASLPDNALAYVLHTSLRGVKGVDQPVKFITTKKALTLRDVPQNILPKRQGGFVINDGQWFIKQDVVGNYSSGARFVDSPNIVTVFKSKSDAQRFSQQLNEAIELVTAKGAREFNNEEILAINQRLDELDLLNGIDFDELLDLIEKGKVRPVKAEAVKGAELPSDSRRLVKEGLATNRIEKGFIADENQIYTKFNSQQPLPTISIADSLAAGINNAVKTGSYFRFRIENVNALWNAAKDFLATPPTEAPRSLAQKYYLLKNATFEESATNPAIANKLNNLRRELLHNLHEPDTYQVFKDRLRAFLEDTVFDKFEFSKGDSTISRWGNALFDNDPLRSLRTMSFHTNMGLGDISQPFVQAGTMLQLSGVAPKYWSRGFANAIAMRMALWKQGYVGKRAYNNFLSTLIKKTPDNSLKDIGDFQKRMDIYNDIGIHNIGNELAVIDDIGGSITTNAYKRVGKSAVDKLSAPFFFAEKNNVIVAFNTAYEEALDLGIDVASQEGKRWLTMRSRDYSMQMTRSGNAMWQRGIGAWPTQFFGYLARVADSFMGRTLTPKQKAGLLAANALMFGTMGVPVISTVVQVLRNQGVITRDDVENNPAIFRGLIDASVSAFVGNDTSFATRAGFGKGFDDIIVDTLFGESNPVYLATGVSGQTAGELIGLGRSLLDLTISAADAAWQWEFGQTREMTKRTLEDLSQFVAPWSRTTRAVYAGLYGELYNNKGEIVDSEKWSKPAAVAYALGFGSMAETEIWPEILVGQNYKNAVDEIAKDVAVEMNRSAFYLKRFAETGDQDWYDKFQSTNRFIQNFMGGLDENQAFKRDVMTRAKLIRAERPIDEALALNTIKRTGAQ